MFVQRHWLGKPLRVTFLRFCIQPNLQPEVLKVRAWLWQSLGGTMLLLKRRKTNNLGAVWKQQSDNPESAWGTQWGNYSLFSEHVREVVFMETPHWEQSWLAPFPSCSLQHKHRANCRKQHSIPTAALFTYTKLHPLWSGESALLSNSWLIPIMADPSPRRQENTPCIHHVSRSESSARPQFWRRWQQVSFHKPTRTHLVKTHHIQARNETLPTARKENFCRWLA